MKISYNNKAGATVTIEGNTPAELVDLFPKAVKPEMLTQLSKDFGVHELALYLYTEMVYEVLEVIEKTEVVKATMVTVGAETPKKTKKSTQVTSRQLYNLRTGVVSTTPPDIGF